MKRTISKSKYIAAFFITIVIFGLGFFLSVLIEESRSDLTAKTIAQQKVDTSSLQLQYLYLNELELDNCDSLNELFKINLDSLDKSMKRVNSYKDSSIVDSEEFGLIQREYILEQIRYWLLAKKVKESCNQDFITALSFIEEDCRKCETQTFTLEFIKKELGDDFLLFHFNKEIKEPMISTLIAQYNITEYPTTVIMSKKIPGLVSEKELLSKICPLYSTNKEVCSTE